ncbi:MAG TPA: hypothetical protein DHV48_06635 [Prolixibacteraceae bacterium]|nr:hypothetical protein [Prolixibacteraceae bacterium]
MKKFLSVMILVIGLLFIFPQGNHVKASSLSDQTSIVADNPEIAPAASVQEEGGVQVTPEQSNVEQETTGNFLIENWGVLLLGLLGFFDLVVRLTPTEKDNSIVNFLMTIFNAIIPNFKKGGGSFKLLSK